MSLKNAIFFPAGSSGSILLKLQLRTVLNSWSQKVLIGAQNRSPLWKDCRNTVDAICTDGWFFGFKWLVYKTKQTKQSLIALHHLRAVVFFCSQLLDRAAKVQTFPRIQWLLRHLKLSGRSSGWCFGVPINTILYELNIFGGLNCWWSSNSWEITN